MTFTIMLLAVVGFVAYRVTSPEQREHGIDIAIGRLRQLRIAVTEPGPEYDEFRDALRARMTHVFVTPAIILISATAFAGMMFGATAISDPGTLVAWGASLGTRTTNGEWWRLVTSTFVHTGALHLLVDIAVLIQLGWILERLIGRLTIAAVYLSAGAFAGLVHLSSHPLAVTVGASGAIFGLYGLLLASLIWQTFHLWRGRELGASTDVNTDADTDADTNEAESAAPVVTTPLIAMKRVGAGAVVFLAYSTLSGFAGAAEFTGLLVGLMYGLVLTRRVGAKGAETGPEKGPTTRHVAFAMLATSAIAVVSAIALRNIADVKPEIARVLATEERTAAAYRAGFDAFKRGRMTAEALAQLAEHTIMPELQAADARLKALTNVPPEHQPLVADAREYLRLRCTSWRVHADALRRRREDPHQAVGGAADASWRLQAEARFRSNMATMGSVESAERASLDAFQRIKLP